MSPTLCNPQLFFGSASSCFKTTYFLLLPETDRHCKKNYPLPQRFNLVHVGIQPLPTPRFYQLLVSKKK
jgi:hypothetical protein